MSKYVLVSLNKNVSPMWIDDTCEVLCDRISSSSLKMKRSISTCGRLVCPTRHPGILYVAHTSAHYIFLMLVKHSPMSQMVIQTLLALEKCIGVTLNSENVLSYLWLELKRFNLSVEILSWYAYQKRRHRPNFDLLLVHPPRRWPNKQHWVDWLNRRN